MAKDGVMNLQIMVDAELSLFSFLHLYGDYFGTENKSLFELEISHVSNSDNGLFKRGITINPNDD